MNFSRIICNNEMINFNVLDRGELAVDNRIQTIWNLTFINPRWPPCSEYLAFLRKIYSFRLQYLKNVKTL
jgi:hypothetical protein